MYIYLNFATLLSGSTPHCTEKTGKMIQKKITVIEKAGNVNSLPKHREFCLLKLWILRFGLTRVREVEAP